MTNKTLPFATILLRSAERDGVADAIIGYDFLTKVKYPTTPTRTTITPIKTTFANPFWLFILRIVNYFFDFMIKNFSVPHFDFAQCKQN